MKANYFTAALMAVLMSFTVSKTISGQESNRVVSNYVSIFGGIEWSSSSAAIGLEYERNIISSRRISAGVNVMGVLPYRYGNIGILWARSGNDYSRFKTALMASVKVYAGAPGTHKGFYFGLSGGGGMSTDKIKTPEKNIYYSRFSPAAEAGIGSAFDLGDHTTMRISLNNTWGIFQSGFTNVKLSLGF